MSSIPFDDLKSKQVLIIPPGETRFIRVSSVRYEPNMQGELEDGSIIEKPGLVFVLEAVFPDDRSVEFRMWNKRSIGMFRPLIETNAYRSRWLKVHKNGSGPQSDYLPTLQKEGFEPTAADLVP